MPEKRDKTKTVKKVAVPKKKSIRATPTKSAKNVAASPTKAVGKTVKHAHAEAVASVMAALSDAGVEIIYPKK